MLLLLLELTQNSNVNFCNNLVEKLKFLSNCADIHNEQGKTIKESGTLWEWQHHKLDY